MCYEISFRFINCLVEVHFDHALCIDYTAFNIKHDIRNLRCAYLDGCELVYFASSVNHSIILWLMLGVLAVESCKLVCFDNHLSIYPS